MKIACVALALAGTASAFIAPMANMRTSAASSSSKIMTMAMSVNEPMSRSQAINTAFASGAAAAVVAGLPGVALADGARSLSTKARARGYYGRRIEDLQRAVDTGDTAAILDQQNIFGLFNSGVYSTDKHKFAEADELAKAVMSAARTGDGAELKKAYAAYTKYTEKKSGYKSAERGRGWGSEFDYKNRTPMGTH